jgi:hypothetical protein
VPPTSFWEHLAPSTGPADAMKTMGFISHRRKNGFNNFFRVRLKRAPLVTTTGTTVGTDMKNVGFVVMAQSEAIDLSKWGYVSFRN